ncbi:sulfatase [Bremerella alba]|uniref:Arylsulfatase n=1 Tax=Bremerella alba TaxID=980252 RepID=A0A7V9A585_9BACT|nr:sulfatase [Bremerella alba]MBA2113017.1 Arylsulfatase [Bremerella alba]
MPAVRPVFTTCCAILLLAFFGQVSRAEKPNVLFIISDDLGSQSLGCFGNQQCRSPNIDALASQGMKFERTYTQYPVCGPSRAALMSGMYAQAIGVTSNGASEKFTKNLGDRPSLAQHFKDNGYYTARVSKIYHMRVPGDITAGVDGPDHAASWTERFNCQAPEQWSEGEHTHLTRERLKPDPQRDVHYGLGYGGAFYVVKTPGDGAEQADMKASAKAIEILEARAKDKQPFFLAVGLVRPHVPLVAPASFFEQYPAQQMTLPEQLDGDWEDIPKAGMVKNSRGSGLDTKLKKQKVLEAYYASVTFMDAQVGKMVAAVDRLGLDKNTIVVFTADHGYHLGEHEFWQKMSLHEESTRIPLIVRVPGKDAAITTALSQQIDIYPTLAELCGLSIPTHVQGKSLTPAWSDPQSIIHDEVYTLRGRNDHLLRTARWAYIRYANGDVELYDMQNDSQQFHNLAQDRKQADTLAELQKRLDKKLASIQ